MRARLRSTFPLAALAAALPLPAAAQQAPPPPAVTVPAPAPAADPARKALALELAHLLNTEAAILGQMRRMFADAMPKAMLANPDLAALEKEHPGIIRAMITSMEPILLRYMSESMPQLWDQFATIYADNLGADDLRAALAFYRGPTGARVIEVMLAELDFGPMLTNMAESGNFEVTSSDLASTLRPGAGRAIARLTPEQLAEAARFGASPAGRRLVALVPQVLALTERWSNEATPELDAELEKAVTAAIQTFITPGAAK